MSSKTLAPNMENFAECWLMTRKPQSYLLYYCVSSSSWEEIGEVSIHTEVRVIVTNRGDRCRLMSRLAVAPRQGLALPLQPSFLYAANDPLGCAAQKIKLEFRLKSNHAFSQEHEISTLTQGICPQQTSWAEEIKGSMVQGLLTELVCF